MFLQIALGIQAIVDSVSHFLNHAITRFLHAATLVKIIRPHSAQFLGRVIQLLSLGSNVPPQLNLVLDVPGIPKGKVRWFSKAHVRERHDPVILMLHGGGYAFGMGVYHTLSLLEIYEKVNDPRLSIVWLDYTLSDTARLPKALEEATAVYKTLIKTSDNITLLGDSAGGHLSLLLTREAHKLQLPKPSKVVLVSPWTNLLPDINPPKGSCQKFKYHDTLPLKTLHEFGEMVVPLDKTLASEVVDLSKYHGWADALPSPDKVLLAYGEKEILVDDIENFAKSAGLNSSSSHVYIEPNGVHASPITLGCGKLRIGENPVMHEIVKFLKTKARQ